MNVVNEIAKEFGENRYRYANNVKEFISEVKTELNDFRNEKDKLIFLTTIKNSVKLDYDEHFSECKNKSECGELKDHLKTIYYLDNQIQSFGINQKSENEFSENEKNNYSLKLDKIISDIEILKQGQELTYNDLLNEIGELKELYFLGKRNWKQLLAGKIIEMVTGGVLSETVSKELIELTEIVTKNYLT